MAAATFIVKLLRVAVGLAALAVVAAVTLVAGVLVYVGTEGGERVLHDMAVRGAAAAGLGELQLDGLTVDFPASMRADRLVFREGGREWLAIEGLQLRPALAALAAGNLRFARLRADTLALAPPPRFPDSDGEVSWPRAVVVDALALDRVVLAGELVGGGPERIGPFRIRADGVYRPASNSFRLDAAVEFATVEGVLSDSTSWRAGPGSLSLDLAGRAGRLNGNAAFHGAAVDVADLRFGAVDIRAHVEPDGGTGRVLSVDAEGDPVELPEAVAPLFGRRAKARVGLNWSDISTSAARSERAIEDAPVRTFTVDVDGGAGVVAHWDGAEDSFAPGRMSGRLRVDGVDPLWPVSDDRVLQLLGDRFSLTADIAVLAEQTVSASAIALRCGLLEVDGDADFTFADGAVRAELGGRIADISVLSESLGRAVEGAAAFDVAVGGTLKDLALDVTARTDGLSVGDTDITAADADVKISGLPEGPMSARVAATVGNAEKTVRAQGRVDFADASAPSVVASLTAGDQARLDFSGSWRPGQPLPRGRLDADIAGLADLGELFGVDVDGRLRAAITSDDRGLSGSADMASLRFGAGVEIDTLAIRSASGMRDAVDVQAAGLRYGAVELDSASADVRRAGDMWRARVLLHDVHGALDIAARLEARESLAASGAAEAEPGYMVTLTELSGSAVGEEVALVAPFVWRAESEGPSYLTGQVGVGEGHLRVDWTVDGDASFGSVHAERFPLQYITPFVDETLWLEGSVAAEIVVPRSYRSGDATKPVVIVSVRGARSADKAAAGKFGGFGFDFRAEQLAQEIVFSAALDGGEGDRLILDGALAAAAAGPPFGTIAADSALRAQLGGELGARAVAELAAMFDARLYGRLTADLRADGRFGDPRLKGRLELRDGRFEDAASGAILERIDVRIDAASADSAQLTISADDGEGGRLDGNGRVDLTEGLLRPRVRASLELRKLRVARLDAVTGRASGKLDLRAAPDAVGLAGTLRTDELAVALPKRLPAAIIELTVVEENVEVLDRPVRTAMPVPPGPVAALDVEIEVPGPAFLRSREVKSEWHGRIEVGGTTAAPIVSGRLELMRGEFDAIGLRVVASEGRIRFDPSPEARHTLDLRGHIRRGNVDVTIIIGGELANLSVRLQSEPPLPEDEILAFLLFGSSVSTLTPIQAVQLAAAVASLANPRTAADPLAWFRDQARLDRVDIVEKETEADSVYMLSAGKYVRDGVFLSVDQPLGEGASEVSIELEVTDRLKLKSSVGADSTGSVGAAWTHDY